MLSRDELELDKMGDAGDKRTFLNVLDAETRPFLSLSHGVASAVPYEHDKSDNSSERHPKPIMCYLDELKH